MKTITWTTLTTAALPIVLLPLLVFGTEDPGSANAGGGTAEVATGEPAPRSIDPPAIRGSTQPAIASEGATTLRKGHDILLTWLEPEADSSSLKFARFSDGTWTRPVTIAGRVGLLSPRDWPSLTVFETQGVRRTLVARSGDLVARSGDAGWTWSRLPAETLPFASFAGGEEGGYAFWLSESRETARLLGTRILAGQTVLDSRVAAGSATDAAMTWDGPVVVYRDLDSRGALNVAMVRRADARWTHPKPVHVEAWRPDGLLVESSPRVAVHRRRVAIAWYTEARRRPRVVVAFSDDAGRTVGTPVEVDTGDEGLAPWGAVDVDLDDRGNAVVLWLARPAAGGAALRLARIGSDGARGESLELARGPREQFAGLPQLTRAGKRLAATWTEVGTEGGDHPSPSRIRAVEVPFEALPEVAGSHPFPAPSAVVSEPGLPYAGRGRVGETLPEFELTDLQGDEVDREALAGRAVLLNVWATWCLPCIAEMPELMKLHERYDPEGLAVVGLNVDDEGDLDKVHRFVAERQLPFIVWLDPGMDLYRELRIRSLPTTFVLDRAGTIVLRRNGTLTADDPEVVEALRGALEQP